MRRRAGLLVLATGLVVVVAPAWADAPQKTAWFSALSAGPLTVPAPTQTEGDLRVGGVGANPTAYTTLLLRSEVTGGQLVLKVVEGSAVGTPELAVCPTKSPTWDAGGNQPFSEGPEYDCSTNSAQGMASSDGASVTFDLDSGLLPAPGTVSLAVVPLPEGTVPFQVDLREPVFTPAEEPADEELFEEPVEEPAEEPAGGTGTAEAPPLSPDSGPAEAPAPVEEEAPAPELAGVETAPIAPETDAVEALPEPEVVLEQAPQAAVLPGAQLAATRQDDAADGPRLLALLTLIGVSAAAGYAAGQQRTTPRIIGGRARALPAGGATAGGALAVVEPEEQPLERGIGRFSRLRDAAPRRLR